MPTSGPFDLALFDCPWRFATWSAKGQGKSPDQHYATLSFDDLAALPIGAVMAKDSLVLSWTTWPHLPQAIALLERWGYHYATGLPWVKRRANGSPKMIMGYYWRGVSELLLIGKRGKCLPRLDKGVPGLLDTIAPAEHSRKPIEQYELIDRLWGTTIRRLEIFARPPLREGWVSIGDQVDGLDVREALRRLVPPAPQVLARQRRGLVQPVLSGFEDAAGD